jgi:hypothetical protein
VRNAGALPFVIAPAQIETNSSHNRGGEDRAQGAFTYMALTEPTEQVAAFTQEVLRAGLMLSGLASDLVEELPSDAFPGEDTAAVVIEMMIGTIHTAVGDVDPHELARATRLLEMASDRVLEHLSLALELRRRMDGASEGGPTPNYG